MIVCSTTGMAHLKDEIHIVLNTVTTL